MGWSCNASFLATVALLLFERETGRVKVAVKSMRVEQIPSGALDGVTALGDINTIGTSRSSWSMRRTDNQKNVPPWKLKIDWSSNFIYCFLPLPCVLPNLVATVSCHSFCNFICLKADPIQALQLPLLPWCIRLEGRSLSQMVHSTSLSLLWILCCWGNVRNSPGTYFSYWLRKCLVSAALLLI